MKMTHSALALVLASATMALASPAAAQYNQPATSQTIPQKPAETQAQPEKTYNISGQARKAIVALQEAVNSKNTAAIPAALAAAQAKAKSKDDNYVISQLQLKAAVDAKDNAAIAVALEAALASGGVAANQQAMIYNNLGNIHANAKAYDKAAVAFEQALKLEPNNVDAMIMLGEARHAQGRTAEGVGLFQKAIAARVAAGQKPDESWYKRSVALAFNAKLPTAAALSRDWVAAYPGAKSWRDSIVIYQTTSNLDDASLLDSMRLAQATGALAGENDYFRFANTLMLKGFPGEAKAVLEQGFAAKAIDRSRATFSQLYAQASAKAQGDRASLAASATAALAAPDAKKAMVTADAYYGYGDYAKAAELYRTALGKSGVDKDLANLRLGMSLARSGDKAGATAALNAAGGQQAEVAKFWLTYLATRA